MSDRMDNKTLINRVTQRTGHEEAIIAAIVDAALEEMVIAFKQGESVSLRNFGHLLRSSGAEQYRLSLQSLTAAAQIVRLVVYL